jgi:nitrite reductase/ring-hydroxylating ferredoxin subunit
MKAFGTTVRQIAAVAAKNHGHSVANPLAQYRFPMTVDEVLADRPVAWPLTRAMCAPMSDGAAALVVASETALAKFGRNRAVRIAGIGVSSGSNRSADNYRSHLTRTAAERCYRMAGIGPGDVSLAEGFVDDEALECWAHGSAFSLRTGKPLNLPAYEPVPVYAVTIEGDDVLIYPAVNIAVN